MMTSPADVAEVVTQRQRSSPAAAAAADHQVSTDDVAS